MILCDIGNTNAHLLIDGKVVVKSIDEFLNFTPSGRLFFVCVNESLKPLIEQKRDFIDLEPYLKLDTKYIGMGSDRVCACLAVNDGVVADAGSAITVDVMEQGSHLGGFILVGLKASEKAYASISNRLKYAIEHDISIDKLPQKTLDAISYGVIKSAVLSIKDAAQGRKIYLTGGDGAVLARFLPDAIYDEKLVFSGMEKIIKENRLEIKC